MGEAAAGCREIRDIRVHFFLAPLPARICQGLFLPTLCPKLNHICFENDDCVDQGIQPAAFQGNGLHQNALIRLDLRWERLFAQNLS